MRGESQRYRESRADLNELHVMELQMRYVKGPWNQTSDVAVEFGLSNFWRPDHQLGETGQVERPGTPRKKETHNVDLRIVRQLE